MKLKIGIFLGSSPDWGGAFQYNQSMLDAVAALPRQKFDVVAGYNHDCWEAPLAAYGIPRLRISPGIAARVAGRLWQMLDPPLVWRRRICPYFHAIARALIRQRCDLWIFPSQDHWAYEVPVPALGVVLDLMHRYERRFPEVSANGEFERREYHYRAMCRWAKGILVESSVGKRQLQECYDMDGTRVHVLPTVAPRYMYSTGVPAGFAERYQLPDKYIFYPAQFWEHKNHQRLVRATASLMDRIPELQLVFVGGKNDGFNAVWHLVQDLALSRNVHFLGYVPDEDMPELYRRARAMVMPSFFGPTNIPPLEAFVAGCPVAASRVYGTPEQVGNAALMFDPNSEAEIADCMHQLWTNDELCKELTRRGVANSKNWNQESFNQRLCAILLRMLEPEHDEN